MSKIKIRKRIRSKIRSKSRILARPLRFQTSFGIHLTHIPFSQSARRPTPIRRRHLRGTGILPVIFGKLAATPNVGSPVLPTPLCDRMCLMEEASQEHAVHVNDANLATLDRGRIVSTPGNCGGKPRISGHRITVKHIVLDHQRARMSPDEIVSAYATLTLSDVYAALAYYYDHRAEIDADIKIDDDHWAEFEEQNPGTLIDRLRQRKSHGSNVTLPPG
jgi:uncharacterized protein (DUF433 family)